MAEAALEATYWAIRDQVAWRVLERDGVVVEGPDAAEWLQGQISQDLASLDEVGASAETLVLSPQGKIDSYCRVTRLGGESGRYLLDVKAGNGAKLHERLRRFKLRVKATVEMVDRLHVLEQRGPRAGLIPGNGDEGAGVLGVIADVAVGWPGFSGRDWLFTGDPSYVSEVVAAGLGGEDLGAVGRDEAFDAARIEAGAPELGSELTERTIPQEAGDLVARTVSFTKGCYTGQELVARIDARGSNTPRRLRGLVVPGEAAPTFLPAGAVISRGGERIGEVTSAAWSPRFQAVVALAYAKRGTDVPAEVSVGNGPGTREGEVVERPAELRPLPLGPPPRTSEPA